MKEVFEKASTKSKRRKEEMGVHRPPPSFVHRRYISTNTTNQWSVKQVTKSNFTESVENIKPQITNCDFIALSLKKTGSFSSPWHRILPIDTADTAYLKARYAAERFQLFQFAVCPSTITPSKLIAHP